MNNKLSLLVNFVGVDKMSGALRNIKSLGRKGSRSLNELRGEGRKLESQLRSVRKEFSGASGNVTALIEKERQLERAIEKTNRDIAERKRLYAIDAQRQRTNARADAISNRGQDHVRQAAFLSAPFILAAREAGNFSSGMVDIQQKAGLTKKQTDNLGSSILTMAQNAHQMPEDMRAGLDLLLAKGGEQLGLKAAQNIMGPAGRIATAYKVEIPDAASAAYSSISNLKVPASQTAKIFDIMASAGNQGAFEVKNMARHFPSLTAQVAALGDEGASAVADLSAALQVAMRSAGSEDQAATNINDLLGKINSPSTARAFEKNFGVNFPAAMKKLRDEGYSTLEAVALVTKEATGGDSGQLAKAFQDKQARQGILALIQNLEEYRTIRANAMNSSGTVDAAFDQRVLGDANVSWRAFLGSTSALATTLGTTLLPVLTSAATQFNAVLTRVSAWAQANPETTATLVKLAGAAVLLKGGIGAAMIVFSPFMKMFSGVNALVLRFAGSWKNAFTIMRTAAMFLASGLMKAGAMMLANPIILVIVAIAAAIGGAAYLIYTHWDTIKAAFWSGVAMVGSALATIWETLKGAFNLWVSLHVQAIQIGKDIIGGLVDGIMAAPGRVWNALKSIVSGAYGKVKDMLGIKSPSRVFMAIGDHTAEGMAIGIDRGRKRVAKASTRLAAGALAAGSLAASPAAAGNRPATPQASAPAPINATFNLTKSDGEDDEAFADRIMRKMKEMSERDARSSYEDDD